MTGQVVQTVTALQAAGGTSVSASFSTLPAVGNAVIAVVVFRQTNAVQNAPTDNQTGNTYSQVVYERDTVDGCTAAIWWLPAVVGSSGTFTVTSTNGSSFRGSLTLFEVSGLTGSVDQTGTAITNGSGARSLTVTAAAQNASASDLVIAALTSAYEASTTGTSSPPSSNFTSAYFVDPNTTAAITLSVAYKFVTATETSSAAWTNNTAWGGACAALATFPVTAAAGASGGGNVVGLGYVL